MVAKKPIYLFLAAATFVAACGKESEGVIYGQPPTPPAVDLTSGKVDPKLVGTWKNPEETYNLSSDGTFKLHYDRMEQVGPSQGNKVRKVGDLSGKWSATDDSFMVEVDKGEKSKHKMILLLRDSGNTLELRPTFKKNGPGTVYHREKA